MIEVVWISRIRREFKQSMETSTSIVCYTMLVTRDKLRRILDGQAPRNRHVKSRHPTSPSDELAPSIRRVSLAGILQRIPPCFFLVALGFLVIGGSLAVGLYYSIAKDRMGDGFTTAGWMIAVGTLVLAAPMAKHYPHCKCWGAGYTILRHGHNTQV